MITHRNRARNPRFHANDAGWWYGDAYHARDVSPPVALPVGADAAVRISHGAVNWSSALIPIDDDGENYGVPVSGLPCCLAFAAYAPTVPAGIRVDLSFWDANKYGLPDNDFSLYSDASAAAGFHEYVLEDIVPPAGAAYCTLEIWCGIHNEPTVADYWITKVYFDDASGTYEGYGDGAAGGGWAWDGAAHDSYSTETVEDVLGANVLINGGASVVFERDVTLALNPGTVAATEMAVRNDEDGYGAWEAFAATKAWTLSAACKVWAKFRDSA